MPLIESLSLDGSELWSKVFGSERPLNDFAHGSRNWHWRLARPGDSEVGDVVNEAECQRGGAIAKACSLVVDTVGFGDGVLHRLPEDGVVLVRDRDGSTIEELTGAGGIVLLHEDAMVSQTIEEDFPGVVVGEITSR